MKNFIWVLLMLVVISIFSATNVLPQDATPVAVATVDAATTLPANADVIAPIVVPVDTGKVLEQFVNLITNWKTSSPYLIASSIIALLLSLLSHPLLGSWFVTKIGSWRRRLVIALLALGGSIFVQLDAGLSVGSVLWSTAIIGCGSILVFELVISLLKPSKVKETFVYVVELIKKLMGKKA